MAVRDESLLDNLAWHALTGPHRSFAQVSASAARYLPDVSIFAATAAERADAPPDWLGLAELAGSGGVAALFRRSVGPVPSGFDVLFSSHAHQMIRAEQPDVAAGRLGVGTTSDGYRIVELGDHDAPDMVDLAKLTEPGPFASRTNQLGRFVGVRGGDGRLIAMAGERFRAEGWTEISGVCTHPDARGQGLAARLTLEIAAGIRDVGATAVLHVKEGNDNALQLYQRLGFSERCLIDVIAVRCPG